MKILNSENDYFLNKKDKNIIFIFNDNFPYLKIIFSILNKINKNVIVINIDNFPNFIKRFDLKSIPCLIFFNRCKEKRRAYDVIDMQTLLQRYFLND